MSNKIKLKGHKVKHKSTEDDTDTRDTKSSVGFLKNKREKGTIASNFSGKSSKEYSRKKT